MPKTLYPIAAVERDTGIGKDTLRVWERRYEFPAPVRDENGERLYPAEQVARLRLIRRLMDLGYRPGKIVGASDEVLSELIDQESARAASADAKAAGLQPLVDMVAAHDCDQLRRELQQRLLREGLQRFVSETVAPLNHQIGLAWFKGALGVSEEHMYTEQVQNLVRGAVGQHASHLGSPRVLLTTFPDEPHGLGLLMVEAMLVPEGAYCVSLGTRTPVEAIASAVSEGRYDIVALSFSSAFPARQAIEGLAGLRARLPEHVDLWAGGSGAPVGKKVPTGVLGFTRIDETLDALLAWRTAHPSH